jgi:hypothetical protein
MLQQIDGTRISGCKRGFFAAKNAPPCRESEVTTPTTAGKKTKEKPGGSLRRAELTRQSDQ